MPLYEILLDSDDHREVRITDQPLAVGDVLEIQGIHWEVVRALAPRDRAHARYQCRRAQEMKRSDEEIRLRAEATRIRMESLERSRYFDP